jgi:hypothetical protein
MSDIREQIEFLRISGSVLPPGSAEEIADTLEQLVDAEKEAFLAGVDHCNMSRSRMDMPRDRIGLYNFWRKALSGDSDE